MSSDNSPDNIAIGSPKDNVHDDLEGQRKRGLKGANAIRKYDLKTVRSMIKDHDSGMGYKALCSKYGISSKGTLHHILNSPTRRKSLDLA